LIAGAAGFSRFPSQKPDAGLPRKKQYMCRIFKAGKELVKSMPNAGYQQVIARPSGHSEN
jgi:hypothetical protein